MITSHNHFGLKGLLLFAVVIVFSICDVHGMELIWDGNQASPPSGLFSFPLNWNPDIVPDSDDTAKLWLGSTYVIQFVGNHESHLLWFANGDVQFEPLYPVTRPEYSVHIGLFESGLLTIYENMILDADALTFSGAAQINILEKGMLTTRQGQIDSGAIVEVKGPLAKWVNEGSLQLGGEHYNSDGTLKLSKGGQLETVSLIIGGPDFNHKGDA